MIIAFQVIMVAVKVVNNKQWNASLWVYFLPDALYWKSYFPSRDYDVTYLFPIMEIKVLWNIKTYVLKTFLLNNITFVVKYMLTVLIHTVLEAFRSSTGHVKSIERSVKLIAIEISRRYLVWWHQYSNTFNNIQSSFINAVAQWTRKRDNGSSARCYSISS